MSEKPEGKPPWPKSEDELLAYIREMLEWPNGAKEMGEGYGRCVYAMSNAALATFNYIAGKLGVTGFQASCAELQFLSDSRNIKYGFLILNAENLLYPQYNLREKTEQWIRETEPRLAEAAKKLLAEHRNGSVHPDVRARWEQIAQMTPMEAAE